MISDHALQAHGHAHISSDLELAHHESSRWLQISSKHGVQVVQRDTNSTVRFVIVVVNGVWCGFSVDVNDTVQTTVKFECRFKSAVCPDLIADGLRAGFQIHKFPKKE